MHAEADKGQLVRLPQGEVLATELDGPAIAREIQKENGSCAALPSAATRIPAATTCRHGLSAAGNSDRPIPAPPAKAAPAAR